MTRPFSLYLDLLRFLAAVTVLLSHFAYPRFTDGSYLWIRTFNLGSDAVIIFFVLSGLVISHTAATKDKTGRQFAFNRLTRLYSVALPAVLLTFALDALGQSLNPENYTEPWHNAAAPLWQAVRALSFTNEWGLFGVRIGSNGPYWSLSYEAAYYIMFGLAFYLQGPLRALLIGGLLLVLGPSVLLLLPVWLMGLGVHRITAWLDLPAAAAAALAILPVITYGLCLVLGVPGTLLAWTEALLGAQLVAAIFGFSNEVLWNTLIGLLVSFHLTGMAILCRREVAIPVRWQSAIRWLAGGSFSLYLLHYPALQFFDAVLPETLLKPVRDSVLLLAVVAMCMILAALTERRLGRLRTVLSGLAGRKTQQAVIS